MTAPGAGTDEGIPPGVVKVGYVPVLKPMFGPFDEPVVAFPLLIPVVPATAPVVAAPPVPPLAVLAAPCARAMDDVTARTEAKAIVVSFM